LQTRRWEERKGGESFTKGLWGHNKNVGGIKKGGETTPTKKLIKARGGDQDLRLPQRRGKRGRYKNTMVFLGPEDKEGGGKAGNRRGSQLAHRTKGRGARGNWGLVVNH